MLGFDKRIQGCLVSVMDTEGHVCSFTFFKVSYDFKEAKYEVQEAIGPTRTSNFYSTSTEINKWANNSS